MQKTRKKFERVEFFRFRVRVRLKLSKQLKSFRVPESLGFSNLTVNFPSESKNAKFLMQNDTPIFEKENKLTDFHETKYTEKSFKLKQ